MIRSFCVRNCIESINPNPFNKSTVTIGKKTEVPNTRSKTLSLSKETSPKKMVSLMYNK